MEMFLVLCGAGLVRFRVLWYVVFFVILLVLLRFSEIGRKL